MTEGQRVAAVLRRAVAKMNDGGKHWTQGSYSRREGRTMKYCSVGGIYAVTRSEPLAMHAQMVLAQVIGTNWVPGWNDAPDRKWSQVKAAFEKAAKLAEKEPA